MFAHGTGVWVSGGNVSQSSGARGLESWVFGKTCLQPLLLIPAQGGERGEKVSQWGAHISHMVGDFLVHSRAPLKFRQCGAVPLS